MNPDKQKKPTAEPHVLYSCILYEENIDDDAWNDDDWTTRENYGFEIWERKAKALLPSLILLFKPRIVRLRFVGLPYSAELLLSDPNEDNGVNAGRINLFEEFPKQ